MFDIYISALSSFQYPPGVEKIFSVDMGNRGSILNTANTQNKSLIEHDQYLRRHFMKPVFRRKIGWKLSDVDLRILKVKLKADPSKGLLFFQVLQL